MKDEVKYPVPRETVDAELSVAQLIDKLRTGSSFTIDKILSMLSASDDHNKAFAIHVGGFTYVVPREKLREYFAENPKPKRPMSKDEENRILKNQLKEMENELLRLRSSTIPNPLKIAPAIPRPEEPDELSLEPEPLPLDEAGDKLRKELAKDLRGKEPMKVPRSKTL